MNSSADDTQFEVSFVHGGRRVQARGNLSAQQETAICAMSGREGLLALSVMRVDAEMEAHSATHLVDTITDAIEIDESNDGAGWDRVRALAAKIDQAADGCATAKALLVEFVWNAGGGDDNLFGQGFSADVAGPENEALVDEFAKALQAAAGDAFYDFGMQEDSQDNPYMSIEDMVDWIDENHDDDPGLLKLGGVLNTRHWLVPRPVGMR